MITTEENIAYQLLDSIRAAELNNDEVVGERLIRSLMRTHRAEIISKYSLGGSTVQDICFQDVATEITMLNQNEYTTKVPPIIRLEDNFGVKLTNLGYMNIAVLNEEEYHLGKLNPMNKHTPKAMLKGDQLIIYTGVTTSHALSGGRVLSVMIDCIKKRKKLLLSAILDDPDSGIGYDWTKSQYPFPPELVDELKRSILKKEFNLIVQYKADQVTNMKNDTLRYHDQGRVQE